MHSRYAFDISIKAGIIHITHHSFAVFLMSEPKLAMTWFLFDVRGGYFLEHNQQQLHNTHPQSFSLNLLSLIFCDFLHRFNYHENCFDEVCKQTKRNIKTKQTFAFPSGFKHETASTGENV